MTSVTEASDISHSYRAGKLSLCRPVPEDGYHVHQLVAASPPLDTNSIYCNLLQATHFKDTSIAAKLDGQLVGFVSGYLLPAQPDTLFVWQVVIAEMMRGQGLAKRMLLQLLSDLQSKNTQYIHTTITPDNHASWALFRSLARQLNCALDSELIFARDAHFGGAHEDEHLLRLGPISPAAVTEQLAALNEQAAGANELHLER